MALQELLFQDEVLHATLYGNLTAVPDPPSRLVNIFVSSTKNDFEHERRQLHEVIVPQLQRSWSSLEVDIQLLDVEYGAEDDDVIPPDSIAHQLKDIEDYHRSSLGCFFLCLIGNKYRPYLLPAAIDASDYKHIYNAATEAGLDVTLLDNRYYLDSNLIPPRYVLQAPRMVTSANRKLDSFPNIHDDSEETKWTEEQEKLIRIIQYGGRIAIQEGLIDVENQDRSDAYLLSGVHTHLRHALRLGKGDRMLCIVRQFEGIDLSDPSAPCFADGSPPDGVAIEEECTAGLQSLLDDVILNVPRNNVAYFSIPWTKVGIDSDCPEHREYLNSFTDLMVSKLKTEVAEVIKEWSPKWEIFPTLYRKSLQEVMRESQSHLLNSRRYLRELGVSQSLDSDCGALLHIQQLMMGDDERLRHTPIIVCGKDGCGKSTVLSQVIMYCTDWLGGEVIRIVRHVGQSPCSTYTSELLRNLCLHISMVFNFEVCPKHHSFELGKLSIWFQDLLKLVENTSTDLVIVLDDLHELRSPPSNLAAILGWLPWNLPSNVHIICSISEEAETVVGLLRSRMPSGDNFVKIPNLSAPAALSMLQSNLKDRKHTLTAKQMQVVRQRIDRCQPCPLYVKLLSRVIERRPSWEEISEDSIPSTLDEIVDVILEDVKEKCGFRTLRKVATFLACTTYGLREPELVELLASTVDSNRENGDKQMLKQSSLLATVKKMKPLLKEYYVDRRPYLHWSHRTVRECVRRKYLKTPRDMQACHTELAAAFHLGFLMEKEKEEGSSESAKRKDEWCDILREIDELWFHLLQSGDCEKLKQGAICNFDFLQCAISGASISYIRSILELVKCQVLDWEMELLSAVTKQSVDILSQDPTQLATELLNWLKVFAEPASPSLKNLITSALRHCNRCTYPLLVPSTSWLTLTLPPQVTVMTCPYSIAHMGTTPDGQYALCAQDAKDIDMFHLPSKTLVRCFKGHKAAVTCLHVTTSGISLVSGSEDTDVIVWQIETGQSKHRMSYHIAGVLCVATNHAESLVLSGSAIGVVVIATMDTGQVVHKLEKHRGIISCVAVNSGDDIFATGSSDKTVCVWSLEDFSLLNTIVLPSSILRMDISSDSTFLALGCKDNTVHVRSLTTGSEVHRLQGIASEVTLLRFAHDSCRCVVGCGDGRCLVFDIHSATLLTTFSGHTDVITGIQVQPKDTFLVTSGGNKIIVWNFSSRRKESVNHGKAKVKKMDGHREPITCVAVSKDGTVAVSGSKDNQLKLWNLTTGEVSDTLEGHQASVTCVAFAPNGLFVVSGSEDMTLKVWGLTLGLIEVIFKEHESKIVNMSVTSDSRRVLSVDKQGYHRLWLADTAMQIYACQKTATLVTLCGNTVFSVGGKNDSSLKFWFLMDFDNEKNVSHIDQILCYTVTYDCQTVVTGSQDRSLKVWEVPTGKLTQVLAGHEGSVTCVSVAPLSPSLVVSGSSDCTLILWDMMTGNDNFTLRGHTDVVRCVHLTPDGSISLSGSLDNTIQLWNTQTGERIGMMDLHAPLVNFCTSLNVSQIVAHLTNSSMLPVFRLHNNPAKGVTVDMLPAFGLPGDSKPLGRSILPKRILLRGNLKREQSFDSLYWDLKSGSPKHDLSTPFEDLKPQRASNPFASPRDQLPNSRSVWDGSKVRPGLRPSDPLSMQPKPKLAKHKLLKKQQSMFAFFPDHNPQKEVDKKADLLTRLSAPPTTKPLDSLGSLAGNSTDSGNDQGQNKGPDVMASAVCSIA